MSRWLWPIAFVMTLLNFGMAQNPPSYFQFRIFYPPQGPSLLSGITLDAGLKQQVENLTWGLKLSGLNLVRQKVGLEASGDFGFARLEFSGGKGSAVDSRKYGLLAIASFLLPRNEDVQYLNDLTLSYFFETDNAAQSGYSLHSGDLSLRGLLAPKWRWNAGYSIATSAVAASDPSLSQTLKAQVSGQLEPIELSFGGSTQFSKNATRYDLKFTSGLPLGETERLGLGVGFNTSGNNQSLTLSSTRFQPYVLGLSLGRSNLAPLSWGLSAEYSGSASSSPEHSLGLNLSFSEQGWRAQTGASLSLSFDPDSAVWSTHWGVRGQVAYKLEALTYNLRSNVDIRNQGNLPTTLSGVLSGGLSWGQDPWSDSLAVGLLMNKGLSGSITNQLLYRLDNLLSLNFSLDYQRELIPVVSQNFSAGLGLRVAF